MTLAGMTADLRCRVGGGRAPFPARASGGEEGASRDRQAHHRRARLLDHGRRGASESGSSYPAVLEAELKRRLPEREIKVVNKGIGGQSAYDMLMRMDATSSTRSRRC